MATATTNANGAAAPPSTHHYYEQVDEKNGRPSGFSNSDLMKDLGAPYFDPMPPDQHSWQIHPDREPLVRIWSWLCHHTIAFGRRWPFAVDARGKELHVEHFAKHLGIEIRNAYAYWKEGKELGLWRNGEAKGEKQRLYLRGTVPVREAQDDGRKEDEEKPNPPGMYRPLPEYLSLQIKDFTKEEKAKVEATWRLRQDVRRFAEKEGISTIRMALYQGDDIAFRAHGLQLQHQGGKPRDVSEAEKAARSKRQDRLLEHVQSFVQTIEAFVQSDEFGTNEPPVQKETAPVSLLPQNLQKTEESKRAGESVNSDSRENKTLQVGQEAKHKQEYRSEGLVSAPRKSQNTANGKPTPATEPVVATKQEGEAVWIFLEAIAEMQGNLKHTAFGDPPVERGNKGDWAWALGVLREGHIAPAELSEFITTVKWRLGLVDQPALGKLPGPSKIPAHSPRERFFGMIREWAADYHRDRSRRQQREKERAEEERKREAFNRAAAERQAADEAIRAHAEEAWANFTEKERAERRAIKQKEIEGEAWFKRCAPDRREEAVDARAISELVRSLTGARAIIEQRTQTPAEEIRACLELIADPKETTEARRWAQRRIAELEGKGARA